MGGAVTTLDDVVNKESLFGSAYLDFPAPNRVQLVISSVPEPGQALFFLIGTGLIVHRRTPWRKRTKDSAKDTNQHASTVYR